jgi:hypothetical protein
MILFLLDILKIMLFIKFHLVIRDLLNKDMLVQFQVILDIIKAYSLSEDKWEDLINTVRLYKGRYPNVPYGSIVVNLKSPMEQKYIYNQGDNINWNLLVNQMEAAHKRDQTFCLTFKYPT